MWFQTIKDSIVWLSSVFPNNPDLHNSVILCVSKQSRPPQFCYPLCFQNNQDLHSSVIICVSKHESGDCLQRCNQWQLAIWIFPLFTSLYLQYSTYLHPSIYNTVLIYIPLPMRGSQWAPTATSKDRTPHPRAGTGWRPPPPFKFTQNSTMPSKKS